MFDNGSGFIGFALCSKIEVGWWICAVLDNERGLLDLLCVRKSKWVVRFMMCLIMEVGW